jgi:hypothetical protein
MFGDLINIVYKKKVISLKGQPGVRLTMCFRFCVTTRNYNAIVHSGSMNTKNNFETLMLLVK